MGTLSFYGRGAKDRGVRRRARRTEQRIGTMRRQRAERRKFRRAAPSKERFFGAERLGMQRKAMLTRQRAERRGERKGFAAMTRRTYAGRPSVPTRVSPTPRFQPVGLRGAASYWGRKMGFGGRKAPTAPKRPTFGRYGEMPGRRRRQLEQIARY